MKEIRKRTREPVSLQSYRLSGDVDVCWDNFREKETLDAPMLEDQQYLCCYCERRIRPDSLRREHYRSRHRHPDQSLDWRNILAACNGRVGEQTCCDVSKSRFDAERDLVVDPRNVPERNVRFDRFDGRQKGETEDVQFDLDTVLNLNHDLHCSNRLTALQMVRQNTTTTLGAKRSWTPAKLRALLTNLQNAPRLQPHFSVWKHWLQRQIRQHQQRSTANK